MALLPTSEFAPILTPVADEFPDMSDARRGYGVRQVARRLWLLAIVADRLDDSDDPRAILVRRYVARCSPTAAGGLPGDQGPYDCYSQRAWRTRLPDGDFGSASYLTCEVVSDRVGGRYGEPDPTRHAVEWTWSIPVPAGDHYSHLRFSVRLSPEESDRLATLLPAAEDGATATDAIALGRKINRVAEVTAHG